MTKADLIDEVSLVVEISRDDAAIIVNSMLSNIVEAVRKGDKVEFRGFGSFGTRQRDGRIGRNPKTGEKVEVPPKAIAFFKPSKELRKLVNPLEASGRSNEKIPIRLNLES